jgi:subtilisin family serine protease
MKINATLGIVLLFVLSSSYVMGQSAIALKDKDWHLGDYDNNKVYGISLEKAYQEIIKGKTPKKKIVVAVIDSGIDTLHEDLKPVIWTNRNEIAGNGIDDDKNGYVDDIHGWNFIGGKDGRNVGKDSYEGARIYYKFKSKYDSIADGGKSLKGDELNNYKIYSKAKYQLEFQAKEAAMYVLILKDIVAKIPGADSTLRLAMGKKQYTGDELQNFKSDDLAVAKAKSVMLGFFQQTRQMENNNIALIADLIQFYEGEKAKVDAVEKEPRAYRAEVVKDNYNDPEDRYYGNNDVMGTDASHGTHVAGIIGAVRNNGRGINGIADYVEILPIRAIPDGDEHDKDVANAIRYAVDNGAWVINMSFGKSFSPEKKWVDDAIRYAQNKGVLLIHAAGNDNKNIDIEDNFPSMNENYDTTRAFSNWISVGASGAKEEELVASFSNFGKREVHVFAPGVKIYSTIPGGNTYGDMDGTSMASPVVAGLSALLLSYFPELSPVQIKEVILKSVSKPVGNKFTKPGTEDESVGFDQLCATGGIVNAFEAFKLASNIKGDRKIPESQNQSKKSFKK